MSTVTQAAQRTAVTETMPIISADSHVHEPPEVWLRVPQEFRERAAQIGQQSSTAILKPGGHDPQERVKEMETDGLSAEVIYPTTGIRLMAVDEIPYQEALFRAYNDWLSEYCRVAPDRLVGLALLSTYDIDHSVKELERCRKQGLHGALFSLELTAELPVSSPHYEPLWDAAQALEMPLSFHIPIPLSTDPSFRLSERDRTKYTINRRRQLAVSDALFDILGVLGGYPRLKVVLAELQVGWIPFVLQEWDRMLPKEFSRKGKQLPPEELPSRTFERQVYATFIDDPVGCKLLSDWGQDNCMWSSDYPHPASSWPHSRESIADQLGHLDEAACKKVVHDNVVRVYPEALKAFP